MNNYLKKLAYIKRELVKLAAPVSILEGGPNYPEPDLQPEVVDEASSVYGPYPSANYDPRAAIPEVPWNTNFFTPPISTPVNSGVSQPSVLANSQTPIQRGIQYSPGQIANLRAYQDYLVGGIARRYQSQGMDPQRAKTQAIKDLQEKGRYYTINPDGTVMGRGDLTQNTRFNDIINGTRTSADISWKKDQSPYAADQAAANNPNAKYTPQQLANLRAYQNYLINGIMRRDGVDRAGAIKQLQDKGRYYRIRSNGDIEGNNLDKNMRFQSIINGSRKADQIQWKGGNDPYAQPAAPPAKTPAAKRKNTYPVGDAGNQYGLQTPKPKMPITPPPGQNSIAKK